MSAFEREENKREGYRIGLQQDIDTADMIEAMMKTPGWKFLNAMMSNQVEHMVTRLCSCTSQEIPEIRGELIAWKKVINTPQTLVLKGVQARQDIKQYYSEDPIR